MEKQPKPSEPTATVTKPEAVILSCPGCKRDFDPFEVSVVISKVNKKYLIALCKPCALEVKRAIKEVTVK